MTQLGTAARGDAGHELEITHNLEELPLGSQNYLHLYKGRGAPSSWSYQIQMRNWLLLEQVRNLSKVNWSWQ